MEENKTAAMDTMDRLDKVHEATNAAFAIIDCARVLIALERAPRQPDAEMATGHGYAWGNCTNDDSIPLSLYHAMGLVREIGQSAEEALGELASIRRTHHG